MKRPIPTMMTTALCALVAACATAPHQMLYVAPDLLPHSPARAVVRAPAAFKGQTLVIAPVTGVGSSNARVVGGALGVPGTAQIWSQTFHEALFLGLRDSRLFADVKRDGTARYVLQAEIVAQSTSGYAGNFAVRYTLNDRQDGRDIWTERIATSYAFPATSVTVIAPYNTELRALMRAGAANIDNLLDHLSALPAVPPQSAPIR